MAWSLYLILTLIVATNLVRTDNHQERCKRQSGSTCFLMPQATEGPYYWNATYNRPNITEDRLGIPFTLLITVMEVGTCQPIPKAAVDVWHCDAIGLYSHFVNASLGDNGGGRPPGPPPGGNGTRPPRPPAGGGNRNTDNSTFLRGLQVTNGNGQATFYTIYPGWYTGRATHIHIKVHINGTTVGSDGVYTGGYVSHTGQLFFDDMFTDRIAQVSPYLSHNITRVLNNVDGIFLGQGGNSSRLSVTFINQTLGFSGGLLASVTLGINSSSIPEPVEGAGGPPPGPDPQTTTQSSHGHLLALPKFALIAFYLFSILFINK